MTKLYDNDVFFAEYSAMDRSMKGLDGAPEWPQYQALLPKLHGLNVLDLGCGMGWFSRWAMDQGVKSSRVIDNSHNMLARANTMTKNKDISYKHTDLDRIAFRDDSKNKYDLVHSSLVLYYLANLDNIVAVDNKTGSTHWSLSYYPDEGTRKIRCLNGDMEKQHRTVATYMNVLLKNGFEITGFDEWFGPRDVLASFGRYGVREMPMFLLMSASKK